MPFRDSPEIGIVRKNKLHSGLLRYEQKGDLDWWHVARDTLAQEKANYVVMMLGVSDRQSIRERDLAKEADKKKKDKDQAAKPGTDKRMRRTKTSPTSRTSNRLSRPNSRQATRPTASLNFAPINGRRFIPSVSMRRSRRSRARACRSSGSACRRSAAPKSTADAVYLNDLYRARAERAGAVYIDVWDGFVDEGGKYSNFGPDYEGQMRRLRSNDGVFFTKYGALKLAHYVEREIRRYMNSRVTPVALPSGRSRRRRRWQSRRRGLLAGPVVPLTVDARQLRRIARRCRQQLPAWRCHRDACSGQRRAGCRRRPAGPTISFCSRAMPLPRCLRPVSRRCTGIGACRHDAGCHCACRAAGRAAEEGGSAAEKQRCRARPRKTPSPSRNRCNRRPRSVTMHRDRRGRCPGPAAIPSAAGSVRDTSV